MKRILPVIALIVCGLIGAYIYKIESAEEKVPPLPEQETVEQEEEEIDYYENEAAERKALEHSVYSFLQGPKAWKKKKDWSGKWTKKDVDGNPFGGFGCGLCCMTNIYDTLSEHEASPWDTFNFARDNSSYAPTGSTGAIGWESMLESLKKMGMDCALKTKPRHYSTFQKRLASCESAICLVCSEDDNTFWPDTPGHYVNVWLYSQEDDTVFLAEPGDYHNNRKTIPAKVVYDALKSDSDHQVLYIYSYDSAKDKFDHKGGIKEKWVRPDYLNPKEESL